MIFEVIIERLRDLNRIQLNRMKRETRAMHVDVMNYVPEYDNPFLKRLLLEENMVNDPDT